MTTQVIFKIDKKLKERAMKKARQKGVPYASILKLATQAFIEDRLDVGLIGREAFEVLNEKTRRELIEISRDIEQGKNLSPRFKTVEEMRDYLKKK